MDDDVGAVVVVLRSHRLLTVAVRLPTVDHCCDVRDRNGTAEAAANANAGRTKAIEQETELQIGGIVVERMVCLLLKLRWGRSRGGVDSVDSSSGFI